jgi:hypothetical protein
MKEDRLKVEIAQRPLSDLGMASVLGCPTPRRKIPFFDICFSTDREPVGPGEIKISHRLYAQRRGWIPTPRCVRSAESIKVEDITRLYTM